MTTNKRWWEEGLRQEFQDFADSIIWSNDEGDEKYIGVGNMADWWVEKIKIIESQAYQRAVEEVEGMKKNLLTLQTININPETISLDGDYVHFWNEALDSVITKLQALKGEEIK